MVLSTDTVCCEHTLGRDCVSLHVPTGIANSHTGTFYFFLLLRQTAGSSSAPSPGVPHLASIYAPATSLSPVSPDHLGLTRPRPSRHSKELISFTPAVTFVIDSVGYLLGTCFRGETMSYMRRKLCHWNQAHHSASHQP